MRGIHLITVGKLKNSELEKLEKDYLKRISSINFSIHEVRSHQENCELEGKEVLKKISSIQSSVGASHLILLAERGKSFDSMNFSETLFNWLSEKPIIFVIGGASGHGKNLLETPHSKISLSAMTFPHKLARLIIVEQIYRAITIQQRHPYHKD